MIELHKFTKETGSLTHKWWHMFIYKYTRNLTTIHYNSFTLVIEIQKCGCGWERVIERRLK